MKSLQEIELTFPTKERQYIWKAIYRQFCKYVDLCFQEEQYTRAYGVIFDFFENIIRNLQHISSKIVPLIFFSA